MENIQYPTQKEAEFMSQAICGKKISSKTGKVSCEFCQKQVKPKSLNRHYNSKKCKEIQRDNFFEECCVMGELEKVKFIFENNCGEMICSDFVDGFLSACKQGHLEIAKYLWENDDNVILLFQTLDGIFDACINGCLNTVKWLFNVIKEHTIFNSLTKIDQKTNIVYFCCKNGKLELLKWLYSKADSNTIVAEDGFHIACKRGHTELAQWIVSLSPNRYKIGENGEAIIIFDLPLKQDECLICYENKTCYQVNCCKKTFCNDCLTKAGTTNCAHCRQDIF